MKITKYLEAWLLWGLKLKIKKVKKILLYNIFTSLLETVRFLSFKVLFNAVKVKGAWGF